MPSLRRRLTSLVCVLAAAGGAGCGETARAFGSTPASLLRGADHFFGGLAARFAPVERSPGAARSRRALIRAALVPSRVHDDTTVWTARAGALRSLLVAGRPREGGYYLWEDAVAPRPRAPGESWHYMNLTRVDEGIYRWNTGVDFSVGEVGAESVADIFGRIVQAGEARSEESVRADYRAAFPRTTAAFGLLASLDTLQVTPHADGSTAQRLVIHLDPARLRARYPHLAKYLARYVTSGRMHLTLRDRGGAEWMTILAHDERIRISLRSRDGRLAPLAGAVRAMPDTMVLESSVRMKARIFTVGFSRLVTEVAIDRRPGYRAWTVIARREPEWHLPLITERLLRTPLKRPFAGTGSTFRFGVREDQGTTLLVRSLELTVEESAILRFLNSLAGSVLDDFDPRTEREQHAYLRELFLALRADLRALEP